jgi:ADP-ribose pyrophosphatase
MTKPKVPKRTILGEQQLWGCKYFDVMEYTVQAKSGERPYFSVRRRHFNTIHILALTPKEEVVLVKQFRPPVGKRVIELPAGLCDNPDEEPADAARRELMEETGFEADEFDLVFSGPVSPGLSNEIYNLFLATDARHTGRGGGVGNEAIEVFLKPRHKLLDYLLDESLQGDVLVDAKLPTALILAAKFMLLGNE